MQREIVQGQLEKVLQGPAPTDSVDQALGLVHLMSAVLLRGFVVLRKVRIFIFAAKTSAHDIQTSARLPIANSIMDQHAMPTRSL